MSADPVLVAVAVGLVLLNACFVAAEFSMVRVRETRIAELVQQGSRRARAVQASQRHLDTFLSATQLGVTLSSLALGWIGEPAVAHLFEPVFRFLGVTSPRVIENAAVAIGFATITFLHIVIGELVPKTYTIRKTEQVALWMALPMRIFQLGVAPLLWLLDRAAAATLKVLGVPAAGHDKGGAHSQEELRILMAESHRLGQISGEKRTLLENVIDYTDRAARHVMIPRADIAYLALSRSLEENLDVIAQTSHTRFPLATLDLDHVVGMVHVKDLFLRRDQLKSSEDLVPLKREIMFVPEGRPLDALQRDFQQRRTHMAIVVDEYGGAAGLVTLEDVIEELVGEIQDEFDRETPQMQDTAQGVMFDGLTVIDDVSERLGVDFPATPDVSTLGGFVTTRLGKIPRAGDKVPLDGYDLTVAEMRGRRVTKVLASRRAEPIAVAVDLGIDDGEERPTMLSFDLTEEQEQLKETARRFAHDVIMPVAAQYDEDQTFPADVAKKAWELGLMNFEVPTEYGGPGLGVLDSCLVLEELNYACAGITNACAANGLAAIPVLIAGSDEQRKRYLGQLANECSFAAFCITEPGAGSDSAGISTTYRRVGDEFVLNGTKHFISNGSVAHWYVVFATADRKQRHQGISAFVLPADLPGIKKHRMKNKLGQRAADTAEVVFEDTRIPASALLGAEGEGFKIAMRTFDRSRPLIGAIAIGVSQRALDESTRYAKERQQFGQPIASFQAIQFMLADMAIEVEAMRLLTYKAAWLVDQGALAPIVSSYSKAFGADHAMRITTDAVQIFGGYGYMKEYPVEKLMRDAKLLQIYEGTSQVQRVVIARNLLKG